MKIAFKIVVFTLMLNLAAGMIIFSIPEIAGHTSMIQQMADQDTSGAFVNGLEGNITLPSTSQSTLNIKDVLLDAIFIGKISKFISGIKTLLFGFTEMLYNLFLTFTPSVGATAYLAFLSAMKGVLTLITSVAYGLGIFWLWTGKALN